MYKNNYKFGQFDTLGSSEDFSTIPKHPLSLGERSSSDININQGRNFQPFSDEYLKHLVDDSIQNENGASSQEAIKGYVSEKSSFDLFLVRFQDSLRKFKKYLIDGK
jgi:hypothetical protein